MTVREGLAELVLEGVIEKRPRVGNFLKPASKPLLTKTVVLLLPSYMLEEDRQHPGTALLLRGMREELSLDDWAINIMAYEQHQLDDTIDQLVARGVDGVLFWPSQDNPEDQVKRLLGCGFPVVMLNRGPLWPDLAAHTVDINIKSLVEGAWKHLDALGHRDILNIRHIVDRWSPCEKAAEVWFESLGGGRVVRTVLVRDVVFASQYSEMIDGLFQLSPLPSAVIVWDEFMAIELMKACQRRGVRVPEDFSVVAIYNQTPHVFQPPLSSPNSCQLMMRLANEACRVICDQNQGAIKTPTTISMVGEYRWTDSVRAVQPSSNPQPRISHGAPS